MQNDETSTENVPFSGQKARVNQKYQEGAKSLANQTKVDLHQAKSPNADPGLHVCDQTVIVKTQMLRTQYIKRCCGHEDAANSKLVPAV